MKNLFVLTSSVVLSIVAANTCLLSCSPGDTLSVSSCFDDYPSTGAPYCPSGWTEIGTPLSKCWKDLCDYTANGNALHSGGIIGTYGTQSGATISVCTVGGNPDGCKCYYGYYAPAPPGGCANNGGGEDIGYYTRLADGSSPRCYYNRDDISCGGKLINSGGTCEIDAPSTTSGNCDNGGTLMSDGVTCRRTYAAVSLVGATRCGSSYAPSSTGCSWCAGITVCLPTGSTCYTDCYAATANPATCTRLGSSCQWCSTSGSIGVCQPKTVACFGNCLAATTDPNACGASSACQWCDTGTSIGVCQPKVGGLCYATCLQSTVESDVCEASQSCKWCSSTSSIGVCQPNAGTCYATCLDASITAEAAVCGGSLLCEWCSGPAYLPYCRRSDEACLSRCVDVAPYNPGICQVPSVGGTCQWCGGLEYCANADDAAKLRCASRCETMIWRQDVCDGALACHWCPQHGGRCKPVKGRTQGYVGWRGESECETASFTGSVTAKTSVSDSHTCSSSYSAGDRTRSETASVTAATVTNEMTMTLTVVRASASVSAAKSDSCTPAVSMSGNASSVTSSLVLSTSISGSASKDAASLSPPGFPSSSLSRTRTPLPTSSATRPKSATATRSRTVKHVPQRLLWIPEVVVAAAISSAFGSALLGSVAGVSGATAVSRMKALLALSGCAYDHDAALDTLTSPTGLSFGPPRGAHYRGGVVGTLLLWVCWCATAAGCGYAYARMRPSVVPALLRLRAPSVFVLGFAVVVEGLCVVSVAAIVHAQVGSDYVVGAVGCAVVLVVLGSCCVAVRRFRCTLVPVDVGSGGLLVALLGASGEWRPRSADAALHLRRHWYLVDGSRVAWYVTLELCVTAACGVVEGLRLDGSTACWVAVVLVLVLALALLIVVVRVRPPAALLDGVFLYLTTAVFAAGSVLLVVSRSYGDSGSVVMATQVVALCGVVIGTLRLLCGAAVWVLQRFVSIRGVMFAASQLRGDCGDADSSFVGCGNDVPVCSTDEMLLLHEFELRNSTRDLTVALEQLGEAEVQSRDARDGVSCFVDQEFPIDGGAVNSSGMVQAALDSSNGFEWCEEEFLFSELLQLQKMRDDGSCAVE